MKITNHQEAVSKSPEAIQCPECKDTITKATREGAQDYCDVYVCPSKHLTRVPVDKPRKSWDELVKGINESTQ